MKKFFRKLRQRNNDVSQIPEIYNLLTNDLKSSKVNLGQIQSSLNAQKSSITSLSEVEFQVFSQWGDDGIIQYLINKIDIPNKTFIEFGVENYTEANTRFLLINNNWTGLIIDGDPENIQYAKRDVISWACELYAEQAFITAENINSLLKKPEFDAEVGILSVDIDGNDYWVWKAIDCINPIIVIVEYNSVFGRNTSWTVPYDPSFVRSEKHSSLLYYGASLKALYTLGKEKGYSFIGCNSKGNNAYFIRNDKLGQFKPLTADEGYVKSKIREAVINGERVTGDKRLKTIEGLEVYDIQENRTLKIDSALVKY
ncbi:hypothetical protein FAM09_05335 [Niastella caeni]|uniref:Uncharacterized protein n=2 Tax=Niastella caeni TaxID=2569763 RepID=A0A4S8I388_9BACT|nr:hypothetical protein FAM09_05335 [Niastella caeni]